MDFESIYKIYYNELYHFAARQSNAKLETADILQDVFSSFYHQVQSGKNIENPRAWLYKVLLNTIRTEIRTNHFKASQVNYIIPGIRIAIDEDDAADKKEKLQIVEHCISRMPETDKNLLLLYHRGFSYREISEILDMNFSSIGTNISRSIEKLKIILKEDYHEMFD
jgi:RNA polymerase sigma-70 factor, ECF subfamily